MVPVGVQHQAQCFWNGNYASMVNSILNQNIDLIICETRAAHKGNGSSKNQSFDHIAYYDLPMFFSFATEELPYHDLSMLLCGMDSIAPFLSLASGFLPGITNITSLGMSFIPRISKIWQSANKLSATIKLPSKLELWGLPFPYNKYFIRMAQEEKIFKFHSRINDECNALTSNLQKEMLKLDTPLLLIAGENDELFQDSQREAYALLTQYNRPCTYIQIPEYSYHDLLESPNWKADVGIMLADYIEKHRIKGKKKKVG